MTPSSRLGWRCVWTHPTSSDRFTGELWPDYETASWIADMLREAGCRGVEIRRGR